MAEKRKVGRCYLVGAGPGDLGLVTLRARQLLERAEVVIYDYLCNPEMLAWAPESAEIIYAGKKAGAHTLKQEEINALLVEKTRAGLQVVRLKGGDPFFFGRGGEEALALAQAGLGFEIVPGVTSAIAAPAYAGIPVTHRGLTSHVTFFTGHEDPEKTESAIDFARARANLAVPRSCSWGWNASRRSRNRCARTASAPICRWRWCAGARPAGNASLKARSRTSPRACSRKISSRRRSRFLAKWCR